MSNEYLDIAMEKVVKQEVHKVLEQIRAEIIEEFQYEHDSLYGLGLNRSLDIIDKYTKGQTKYG